MRAMKLLIAITLLAAVVQTKPLVKPVELAKKSSQWKWTNCGTPNDMSTIKNVTITPNPPAKGNPVTIDAHFVLKENITGGSFTAKVKYSIFPTVSKIINVCDLAKLAGLSCPVSQNTTHVVISQKVPSIPSGHYTGKVVGVDQNGKQIGCINIDIHV